MLSQRFLNFFQFDAEAVDLNLLVAPADKLQRTVCPIADQVARLVHNTAIGEGIRNEFLRG